MVPEVFAKISIDITETCLHPELSVSDCITVLDDGGGRKFLILSLKIFCCCVGKGGGGWAVVVPLELRIPLP